MKTQTIGAMRSVLETIPKAQRSGPTRLERLLLPLFRRLPREVQLRLSRDALLDMTAAMLLARESFGDVGNVRVDGDECQIGTTTPAGDFAILGRGTSWDAAWSSTGTTATATTSTNTEDSR